MTKSLIIQFEPSKSIDVVDYILYIEASPKEVTYNSLTQYNIIENKIDLANYIEIPGIYNIGIASRDKVGNLSSIRKYDNIKIESKAEDPIIIDDDNDNNVKIYWIIGIVVVLALLGTGFWYFS